MKKSLTVDMFPSHQGGNHLLSGIDRFSSHPLFKHVQRAPAASAAGFLSTIHKLYAVPLHTVSAVIVLSMYFVYKPSMENSNGLSFPGKLREGNAVFWI